MKIVRFIPVLTMLFAGYAGAMDEDACIGHVESDMGQVRNFLKQRKDISFEGMQEIKKRVEKNINVVCPTATEIECLNLINYLDIEEAWNTDYYREDAENCGKLIPYMLGIGAGGIIGIKYPLVRTLYGYTSLAAFGLFASFMMNKSLNECSDILHKKTGCNIFGGSFVTGILSLGAFGATWFAKKSPTATLTLPAAGLLLGSMYYHRKDNEHQKVRELLQKDGWLENIKITLEHSRKLAELASALEKNWLSLLPSLLDQAYPKPLDVKELTLKDKEVLTKIGSCKKIGFGQKVKWLSKIISSDQDDHDKKAFLDEVLGHKDPIEE
ncbi:MAG: hypothetical protein WCE21_05430 [Candidatus Babeliales bacterium]